MSGEFRLIEGHTMIDNLSSPNHSSSPAMPAIPGISAAPSPAASDSAGGSNGLSSPQDSFASTLQSRLKAMAVSKAPQSKAPVSTEALDAQHLQATLAISLAASASSQGKEASAADLPALALAATADLKAIVKQDKTGKSEDSNEELPALATEPPATVPIIALPISSSAIATNTIAPGTQVIQGNSKSRGDDSTVDLLDQRPSDSAAPTAILAAPAEKSGKDTLKPGDSIGDTAFSDLIKTSTAHAGSSPIQAQTQIQTPTSALPLPLREVPTPVTSAAWGSDVGNQVSWMVSQRESRAELVLNPPHLGRIEVSITLNGDQASANFVSANPEVRDALHDALPRLREVLADAGVSLGQANIGSGSSSQNGNGAEKGRNSPGDSFSSTALPLLGSTNAPTLSGSSPSIARGQGLIDLFA
jgi:flagellar hook-length control protein FliK